jgi:drug/metabolite transporter (DMT)-like permease
VKLTTNFILLIPVFSIIAGIIILKEEYNSLLGAATVLIILGAYLTSLSKEESYF